MKYLLSLCTLLFLAACGGGRTGPVPVVNGSLEFPAIQGFELHAENVDGLITWYDESNRTRVTCRRLAESEHGRAARDLKAATRDGIVTTQKSLDSLGNCSGTGGYVDVIRGGRYQRIVAFEARVGDEHWLISACCDRAEKLRTQQMYEAVVSKLTMSP